MAGKDRASPPVPQNWPPHLRYLSTPLYTNIAPGQRQQLQVQPSTPLSEIPTILRFGPSSAVEIRKITDVAHPAHGQSGLFAARDLRPGAFILPYLGEYHPGAGPRSGGRHATSDYDLWLDREANVAVDAERAGNEARFVNDYRGTGKPRPNAEFREVWDPRRGERGMAVFVLPLGKKAREKGAGDVAGIKKGEEILVSYGKGFWEKRREAEAAKEVEDGSQSQETEHTN